ncbi:MAG: hypothetical protein DBY36_03110 [Clostridiales bacterium]|nr:MAG: hypothetical protein DBY36_03110 [Clostridiales bacterium]
MEEAVRYTSFAIAAVLCAVLIKKAEPSYGFMLTLTASICVCVAAMAALSVLADYARETEDLFKGAEGAVEILIKILGITLTTCFGAQVCRDCGEGSLAFQLELLGGALGLINALPLLSGVLAILRSFMG